MYDRSCSQPGRGLQHVRTAQSKAATTRSHGLCMCSSACHSAPNLAGLNNVCCAATRHHPPDEHAGVALLWLYARDVDRAATQLQAHNRPRHRATLCQGHSLPPAAHTHKQSGRRTHAPAAQQRRMLSSWLDGTLSLVLGAGHACCQNQHATHLGSYV